MNQRPLNLIRYVVPFAFALIGNLREPQKLRVTFGFLWTLLQELTNSFSNKSHRASNRSREREFTIGFDGYPFLEPLTGVGWYAYHLLRKFAKKKGVKINLYARTLVPEQIAPGLHIQLDDLSNVRFRCYPIPREVIPNQEFWVAIGTHFLTPFLIATDRNDVFFAPNFYAPKPFRITGKKVITIHDCTFAHYPELLHGETLKSLKEYLPEELKTASRIIAVSAHTKEDVRKLFSVDPGKIVVVHNGNRNLNYTPCEITRKPYILFVGTLEPRKNVASLLDAFEIIRRKDVHFNLYLIGKQGWKSDTILEKMRRHPFSSQIFHLSYLPTEQLAAYYKEAFCFVFPSLYEGFGLPVLEAMSLGCPVIATRRSSIPEVGGKACLYVDPDAQSIAEGIIRLYQNTQLRETLIIEGKRQAAKFSWEKSAERTLEVLKAAADCN